MDTRKNEDDRTRTVCHNDKIKPPICVGFQKVI